MSEQITETATDVVGGLASDSGDANQNLILGAINEMNEAAAEETPVNEDVSDAVDVADDTPTDDGLILGKFKTQEALAEAYKNAERKMHETNAKLKQLEESANQFIQQQQQQQYVEPERHTYFQPESAEDLVDLAYTDPTAAMDFAAEAAPHLVPTVLSAIREVDPARAELFSQEWQEYRIEQRLQQALAPIQQQAVMQQKHQAVTAAYQHVSQLPGFDAVKNDVAEFINNNPALFHDQIDPVTLRANLEVAYYATIGKNPQIMSGAQAQLDSQRGVDHAGNLEADSSRVSVDLSQNDPADMMRQSILAQNKKFSL